jgi:hypothetical protein
MSSEPTLSIRMFERLRVASATAKHRVAVARPRYGVSRHDGAVHGLRKFYQINLQNIWKLCLRAANGPHHHRLTADREA